MKIGILLFGFSIILSSCDNDELIEPQEQKLIIAHKNFDFIENNINLLNKVNKLSKPTNKIASKGNYLSKNEFTVFKERVTYIKSTDNKRESYSFYIERNNINKTDIIENLILSKTLDDNEYKAHIITYSFPEGIENEKENFVVTNFEELDTENVSNIFNKSSCENTYEYTVVETKHDCYSGNHSGAGEAESCDGQGSLPYSTWSINVTVNYQCDGGGSTGGGTYTGDPIDTGNPSNNTPPNNSNPIDTGITLPPSCQTSICGEEITANTINDLLDNTLSYDDLLWLNDNSNEADVLKNLLEQNDWTIKLKLALASGITTTAEVAHDIYNKCSAIAGNNPNMIKAINILIRGLSTLVNQITNTSPQNANWADLFNMWLFEIGQDLIVFDGDDVTTLSLKNQEGVNEARDKALAKIAQGNFNIPPHTWVYGQGEFYDGITNGNIATAFLGSYTTSVTAVQNINGTVTLTFNVNNTSGWASATRLRIDNDNNGSHDPIILDKNRGQGINLGGNFSQIWSWSETF